MTVETDPASISVQLIRIRSDWSKAKDPEAAEKALQSLTDGVALPAEVRNNLLTSAPQILCPEGFIAGYRPNEYLDMLTWLKDQDLAQTHAQSKTNPLEGRPQRSTELGRSPVRPVHRRRRRTGISNSREVGRPSVFQTHLRLAVVFPIVSIGGFNHRTANGASEVRSFQRGQG